MHSYSFLKPFLRPAKIHGFLFDSGVFLGNLLFLGVVPTLGDNTPGATAGGFLLAAVISQILGARLKRGPLGCRLHRNEADRGAGLARYFMLVLLFLHFILFTVITVLALVLLGIYEMGASDTITRGDFWILIAFGVGGFATLMVWRAERAEHGWTEGEKWVSRRELAADGFLWVSVSIVTQIFWGGLVELIEPVQGIGLSVRGVILLFAMSLLFVFFYLPSRYLFLVEDYRSPWTWLQVWVAMVPVVWVVVA